jgi:hypothetical protein
MSRDRVWRNKAGQAVTTWRRLMQLALEAQGERLTRDVLAMHVDDTIELDAELRISGVFYTSAINHDLVGWTPERVYFSIAISGRPFVLSARRDPPAELLERSL